MESFTIDDDILTKAMITWGIRLQAMKTIEEVTEYAIEAKIFDEKVMLLVSSKEEIKSLASEEADILIMTAQISKYMDSLTNNKFSDEFNSSLKEMEGMPEFDINETALKYINVLVHTLDGKKPYGSLAVRQAQLIYLVQCRRKRVNKLMLGIDNPEGIYTNLVKETIDYKIDRVKGKLNKYG
jgi:hypothetical protein